MLGNPVTLLLMSPLTGYLIQKLGWQTTFVAEGIPSILWGVVWIVVVRDRPSDAKWLDPRAAEKLEDRLAREQVDLAPVGVAYKVFLRGDVLLLAAQYFCWSLGVYGFVLWLPTIVRKGAELSMAGTGLLSALPYLAAIVLMLIVSHISDKTLKRRSLVWPLLMMAGIALTGSFLLAEKSFTLTFICLVICGAGIYAPYGPFFAIIPERLPRNVTAEVLAFVNSSGALGGFFGSYLVGLLQATTGNARAGYLLMSFSLIFSAILMLFLRDARHGSPHCEFSITNTMSDHTGSISARQVFESDASLLSDISTHARGPEGSLPIAAEMLLTQPSGNLFGLSQNAGMGWELSRVLDPEFLILSTHGGVRAPDGTPIALGFHTGHWEVGLLVAEAARELRSHRAIPFAGACTDPCDGRTQGTAGMLDSLPYRNDAAIVLRRLMRSLPTRKGVIGVATCDKGLPAMMMALASSGPLPSILVPGGVTLLPENGEDAGKVQTIGARYAQDQITLEYAAEVGCRACATPGGGCQFLGTAATSQVVAEALGLSSDSLGAGALWSGHLARCSRALGSRHLANDPTWNRHG